MGYPARSVAILGAEAETGGNMQGFLGTGNTECLDQGSGSSSVLSLRAITERHSLLDVTQEQKVKDGAGPGSCQARSGWGL